MTDATSFGVETIELDLPLLAGTLSRRLHDAGLPVTPARSVEFARALDLVRPVARRRLYWTARSVFVSDPMQADAFDAVFASVFGGPPLGEDFDPEDARTVAAPPDERPAVEHDTAPKDRADQPAGASVAAAPPGGQPDDGEEVEVPLLAASDEEQLGRKHSTPRAARACAALAG